MTCQHLKMPDGGVAIVCSRDRPQRCKCGRRAAKLCDWKVTTKKSGTCDTPLCERCAVSPAPEKDLCPPHARMWKKMKSKHT